LLAVVEQQLGVVTGAADADDGVLASSHSS
jgi:hypothetical protein